MTAYGVNGGQLLALAEPFDHLDLFLAIHLDIYRKMLEGPRQGTPRALYHHLPGAHPNLNCRNEKKIVDTNYNADFLLLLKLH